MKPYKAWLWIREDGLPPKVIEVGKLPPGPGRVFEVEGVSSDDMRAVYARSLQSLPDVTEAALGELGLEERKARRRDRAEAEADRDRIREVDLAKLKKKGGA